MSDHFLVSVNKNANTQTAAYSISRISFQRLMSRHQRSEIHNLRLEHNVQERDAQAEKEALSDAF